MGIFVAGATGKTGRLIVQQVVKKDIPIKALVRNLAKAREIIPDTVTLVEGDVLDTPTFESALSDCNLLICAIGASPSFNPTGPFKVDYLGTKNLIDAAKVQGVKHFILVSSLCVSKLFHPLNLFWLVLYWKKKAEVYLQASGISYTIVRPGGLNDKNNDSEAILISSQDTLFEGSISCQKVAQVRVEAISYPEAKSKILEVIRCAEMDAKEWSQLFHDV